MINLTHKMSLATVSAVVVGAAGIVATQGQAAHAGYKGPPPAPKHEKFEHPNASVPMVAVPR